MADNLHSSIPDTIVIDGVTTELRHYPRAFERATNNSVIQKNESAEFNWKHDNIPSSVLDFVDSDAVPPTTNDGDRYILHNDTDQISVDSIAWQSGYTVRYSFDVLVDLSGISAGYYIRILSALNSENDGVYAITAVNTASSYIEITNTSVDSTAYDEPNPTTAKCYFGLPEWTGATNDSIVEYDAESSAWNYVQPTNGDLIFVTEKQGYMMYNNAGWIVVTDFEENLTTTNNTTTTIATLGFNAYSMAYITAHVMGIQSDGSKAYASKLFTAAYNNGGTYTIVGSLTKDDKTTFAAGVTASITTSGTDVLIRVTGAAATTIVWKVFYKYNFIRL